MRLHTEAVLLSGYEYLLLYCSLMRQIACYTDRMITLIYQKHPSGTRTSGLFIFGKVSLTTVTRTIGGLRRMLFFSLLWRCHDMRLLACRALLLYLGSRSHWVTVLLYLIHVKPFFLSRRLQNRLRTVLLGHGVSSGRQFKVLAPRQNGTSALLTG